MFFRRAIIILQNTQCNAIHNTICSHSCTPSTLRAHPSTLPAYLSLSLWLYEWMRVKEFLLQTSWNSRRIHFPLAFHSLFMCFVLLWHSWFVLLITSIPLLVDIHDNPFFSPFIRFALSLYAEALTVCSYDVCSVKILISIWINISSLIMVCECINHTHSKPSEWYINEQYQKWMKSTHNERSENRKKEWQMQRYGGNEIEREKRRKKGTNETKNSQWMHRAVQSIAYGFSAHECSCVAH